MTTERLTTEQLTERDDGHGMYMPVLPVGLSALAEGTRPIGQQSQRMARELLHLRERQEVHLKLIADLSKQEVSPEHAERLNARVASLVAEVGTLRSQLSERDDKIDEWKAATGIVHAGGDPEGIEPLRMARMIQRYVKTNAVLVARSIQLRERLRRREQALDAERKFHASTLRALKGDAIDLHEDSAGLVKQNLDLRHQIDEWKAACGLIDSSGDPGGIEPRHLVKLLLDLDRR